MSDKRNRLRSSNWDEEEKHLFRSVLREYTEVIENKSLSTNTNKAKTKAWEQVFKKFNHLNSRPRDLNQLKVQWKAMKVLARRKECSLFKKDVCKTGGGPPLASPSEAVLDIKHLLNPAELLREHNIYDSDGVVLELQNKSLPMISSLENVCASNISLEKINDNIEHIDDEVASQEFDSLLMSKENASSTPIEKDNSVVKLTDDDSAMVAPKSKETIAAKKVAKRKINLTGVLKSKKQQQDPDYVSNIINHSRVLKDYEHSKRMEMAKEEHEIKMEIHRQHLKIITLQMEREKRQMEMAEEEHCIKINIQKEIYKKNIKLKQIFS